MAFLDPGESVSGRPPCTSNTTVAARSMSVTGNSGTYELAAPYRGERLVRVDVVRATPTDTGPITIERGRKVQKDIELAEAGRSVRVRRSDGVI